ncbi:MAG: hypothetical protein ACYCX2_04370 [Christensenellales bacterium]
MLEAFIQEAIYKKKIILLVGNIGVFKEGYSFIRLEAKKIIVINDFKHDPYISGAIVAYGRFFSIDIQNFQHQASALIQFIHTFQEIPRFLSEGYCILRNIFTGFIKSAIY